MNIGQDIYSEFGAIGLVSSRAVCLGAVHLDGCVEAAQLLGRGRTRQPICATAPI